MPKDKSQLSEFSRREHISLREQAHTRRHQLRSQKVSPLKGSWCETGLAPSAEAELEARELEACFSALSLDFGRPEPMEGVQPYSLPDPPMEQDTIIPDPAAGASVNLIRALKVNASLRRRMVMLERQGEHLQSQLMVQKRATASSAAEAEGARRLVLIAEDRFRELEGTIEKLRQESYRCRMGWLSEHYSLRDLLRFVPDRNEPAVSRIASSSRQRFLSFSSDTASPGDVQDLS